MASASRYRVDVIEDVVNCIEKSFERYKVLSCKVDVESELVIDIINQLHDYLLI